MPRRTSGRSCARRRNGDGAARAARCQPAPVVRRPDAGHGRGHRRRRRPPLDVHRHGRFAPAGAARAPRRLRVLARPRHRRGDASDGESRGRRTLERDRSPLQRAVRRRHPAVHRPLPPAALRREARLVLGRAARTGQQEMHELLHHKRPYLNLGFFIVRAAIYFAVWSAFAWLMRAWSLRQDETADPALTVRARWWSPPGLLLFAITFTFAAFDWLLSLQPTWYSTIFGLYISIGGFVASIALLCLVITGVRSRGSALGAVVSVDRRPTAGKLLRAFNDFWA